MSFVNYIDPDTMFANMAVRLGLVDPSEARLCAQLKHQSGGQVSLEQLLLHRGSLSAYNAQIIRQQLSQLHKSSQMGAVPAPPNAPSQPHFSQQPAPHFSQQPAPHFSQQSGGFGSSPAAPGVGYQNPVGASYAPAINESTSHQHAPSSALISVAGSPASSQFRSPISTDGSLASGKSSELPKIGDIFGRYRIESILGKGGMGIVFKAIHEDLGRTVALKMLIAGTATSDKQLRRFFTEARSAARLSHPCIVPIHDVGELGGLHFFTMDYIEGTDLATELQKRNFSEKEALTLIKQLAEALDYAHTNQVIHRDLKPANILLDDTEAPKITDFGIAKDVRVNDGDTMSGEVLGTPAYMSPEQADGSSKKIDGRADIFSLGTILYEMLYKDQAFKGATQYAIVTQVLTVDPEPPVIEQANVSEGAAAICFKCLKKRPEDRYSRGRELADDLGRVIRNKKAHAPPYKRKNSSSHSMKRPAGLVATLVAVLVPILLWGVALGMLRSEFSQQLEIGEGLLREYRELWEGAKKNEKQSRDLSDHHMQQAKRRIRNGEMNAGLLLGRKAIELIPDNALRCLEYLQLVVDALTDSKELASSNKDLLDNCLIVAEGLLEDLAASKQAHQKKVELLWLKNDSLATRKALSISQDKFPELAQSIFSFRYNGLLAELDGSWGLAISEFQSFLKKDGRNHVIRARLARAFLKNEAWKDALREANYALAGNPSLPLALYAQAAVLNRNRKYTDALNSATRAAQLNSEIKRSAQSLKRTIERNLRNKPKPAKSPVKPQPNVTANRPGKLSPKPDKDKHQRGHIMLREASALLAANSRDDGLRKVIQLESYGLSCASGFNELGVMQNTLGRFQQALTSFNQSIRLCQGKPVPALYNANKSYICKQLRRFEEALAADRQAMDRFYKRALNKRDAATQSYMTKTRNVCLRELVNKLKALVDKKQYRKMPAILRELDLTFKKLRAVHLPLNPYKTMESSFYESFGDYSRSKGQKEQALSMWRRAIKIGGLEKPESVQKKIRALDNNPNK